MRLRAFCATTNRNSVRSRASHSKESCEMQMAGQLSEHALSELNREIFQIVRRLEREFTN